MVECSQDMLKCADLAVNEVKEKSPLPKQLALFPEGMKELGVAAGYLSTCFGICNRKLSRGMP